MKKIKTKNIKLFNDFINEFNKVIIKELTTEMQDIIEKYFANGREYELDVKSQEIFFVDGLGKETGERIDISDVLLNLSGVLNDLNIGDVIDLVNSSSMNGDYMIKSKVQKINDDGTILTDDRGHGVIAKYGIEGYTDKWVIIGDSEDGDSDIINSPRKILMRDLPFLLGDDYKDVSDCINELTRTISELRSDDREVFELIGDYYKLLSQYK